LKTSQERVNRRQRCWHTHIHSLTGKYREQDHTPRAQASWERYHVGTSAAMDGLTYALADATAMATLLGRLAPLVIVSSPAHLNHRNSECFSMWLTCHKAELVKEYNVKLPTLLR
jgi:hypothetical protein